MNRRSFLARLGFGTVAAAAAATGVLDVERLLWVPGEKTIFLPSASVVVDYDWMDREFLRIMQKNLALASDFNRQYDEAFKVGQVIAVRRPRRWAA